MKRSAVYLPSYVIGSDAYEQAADVLKTYGRKAVIIGGERAMAAGAKKLEDALQRGGIDLLAKEWYGGSADPAQAERLAMLPAVQEADMILAMGGGRCSDVCKVTAQLLGKPLFTFPTIASNCAPVTALAILYNADGVFLGNTFVKQPPVCCFIDTEIIAHAPAAFLRAGIGDALSKAPEVLLALRNVPQDQNLLEGKCLADACMTPLLRCGAAAMEAVRMHTVNEALEDTVLAIIVSTGLVSNLLTCREYYYNSNLAHCFYYGATVLPVYEKYAHGEWVAYGVLALLAYDGQTELLRQVLRLNKAIGLPTCLADLEIGEADLTALIDKAASTQGWKIKGYETSKDRFREAILAVDRLALA